LGNFINRVVVLTKKYYDSVIPDPNELNDVDNEVIVSVNESVKKIEKLVSQFKFRDACAEFINIARFGNKYLADEEPWKIIKVDPERVKTILFIALHISSILSIVSEPFLPFTSKKIKFILNSEDHSSKWTWENLENDKFLISKGVTINEPELLFTRIEDSEIEYQIDKLKNNN
jgi:methionyl-tRNA synthetase